MRNRLTVKVTSILVGLLISNVALADCTPYTLHVTSSAQATTCVWPSNDSAQQQLWLLSSENTPINAICNFTPVEGSRDKVSLVFVDPPAAIHNLLIEGNQISFNITPYTRKAHMFFIINQNHQIGDRMVCHFKSAV